MTSTTGARPVGALLREWRERRRLSQLELASQAEVSTRHLSFVETGRSRPTPEMIVRLTEQLDVPMRERNTMLLAGGYAPIYPEHGLDEPELDAVRAALAHVLAGHEPYPALLVTRWWDLVEGNRALSVLTDGVAAHLLEPPVNALRLALHPDGLAPRIENLHQWRTHLLTQLAQRARASGDTRLAVLHDELAAYPGGAPGPAAASDVVLPLRLTTGAQVLSLFSIHAAVGSATDVTVAELSIEAFYPGDPETAEYLRARSA